MRHFERFSLAQPAGANKFRQISAVRTSRHIMPRGNGTEGAGVVIEAGGVVESAGLGHRAPEIADSLERVEEPPGRSQPQ